ncbi:matrixin family metalloprotease [uncultured Roseovarius sp.]|uniref:matrixin family metalloprotease n=1 Tax=uncultured Roseovarius sp. TaxID=293344 RepID=UPI00261A729A|nr:matrixin family metalloprotease [uncultured Roseovarius sp.]
MPNISGYKWGSSALGTSGGTVTWSVAGANRYIYDFYKSPVDGNGNLWRSVEGRSFLNFNFKAVIADALAEWSKYADIKFRQVPDQGAGAGFSGGGDISFFFGHIPGNTLGQGFYPFGSHPIAGDILLDVRSEYNYDRTMFKGLVLHEIGHALGLGHVERNSIMTSFLDLTTLQRDDRNGIRQIYGDPDVEPILAIKGGGVHRMRAVDNDLVAKGNGFKNTIIGTVGPDTMDGGGHSDRLIGGTGADDLRGGSGNDVLIGGTGADILNGGGGLDTVDYSRSKAAISFDLASSSRASGGQAEGDRLISIERVISGSGNDTLEGSGANERFIGGAGGDILSGGGGHDRLNGQTGSDTLNGGSGNDRLAGDFGNDLLQGETGNDTLSGQGGEDTLEGGDGDDLLRGGNRRDTLEGGTGDDVLEGNEFADTFIFADGHGDDRIVDFNTAGTFEVIDLRGVSALNDFADVTAAATNTAGGVLIDTGGGDSILLSGVWRGQLAADDFLF